MRYCKNFTIFKLKTQLPQLLRIDKVKKNSKNVCFIYIFEIFVEIKIKTNPLFAKQKNSLKVFCQLDLCSTFLLCIRIGISPNSTDKLLMIDVGVAIALFAIDNFIPIGFKGIHRIF